MDTKDYVLNKFNSEELKVIENNYPKIKKIVETFIKYDIIECMSRYNSK